MSDTIECMTQKIIKERKKKVRKERRRKEEKNMERLKEKRSRKRSRTGTTDVCLRMKRKEKEMTKLLKDKK